MKQNVNEIWRDIIGYEDYYEVSNLGRIRSLNRTVLTKRGERFYKGRILKKTLNNTGYQQVGLSKDDKKTFINIHQLVAIAFLGHTPNGFVIVVDHINGNKLDNRVENLRIVTHRDNISTCYRANEDSFSSELIGVTYHKASQKWQAQIYFNSKQIYLGRFKSEIDASDAYQKALAKIENGTFKIEDYRAKFSSNHIGVYFHKASQKWMCQPIINGKRTYLGIYPTEEEAHQEILEFEAIQPIVNNS